jgi:F-type H+-transporting ATPase subunit a
MAAEGHETAAPSAGEYIIHHLKHFQNGAQKEIVDFSFVNFDSIFFSVLLGVVGSFLLWRAAKSATSGVPGRFQAAVEILVEIVADQAKGIVHSANSRKLVAPLARLDLPDERDGPVPGRPVSLDLAEHHR